MSDFSEIERETTNNTSHHGDDFPSKRKHKDFRRGVWMGAALLMGLYVLVIPLALQVIEFNTPTEKIRTYQQICMVLPAVGVIGSIVFLAFKRPQVARGMAVSLGGFIVVLLVLYILFMMIFGIGCGGLGGC